MPTKDIDAFWHQHILDTPKYAADCRTVFGEFLHHFPDYDSAAEQVDKRASFKRTIDLFMIEFGEKPHAERALCRECYCDSGS